MENQATDRAYRIGQKRNVVVHKFICKGTVEEKIDALIEDISSTADISISDQQLFACRKNNRPVIQMQMV